MTLAELETCKFLLDKMGRSWVNEEQIAAHGYQNFQLIDLIKVGDDEFYDVVGYSQKRRAFWVEPVEYNFDDIESEVSAYVESLREDSTESE